MRDSKIQYNPSLSVKENAKKNGVSEAAIRYYIKVNHLDRRADRLMNLIENCRAYLKKHPTATKAEIHRATGHSVSAITKHWEYITTDKEPERKDRQFESYSVQAKGKELASALLNESQDILQFADGLDVSDFRKWLLRNQHLPMIVIGNGGKHTSYPALMYEMMSGVARTITPLEFASMSPATIKGCKILLLSSGGRNQDIVFATQRALSYAIPENIACLTFTNDETNKVVKALKGKNTFVYKNPYTDGFIAIRSKILTYAILYKAFYGRSLLAESIKQERAYKYKINGRGVLPHPKNIKHFCVLYSSYGEPVAHDIESTMTESGIASVQICDYRNYCHGRFIFGSNHPQETCMVLLITPRERELAKRIRENVLPSNIPVVEITTERNDALATIELLLDSMHFMFDVAERYHGVNPNSPQNLSGIDKRFPISGVKFVSELSAHGELCVWNEGTQQSKKAHSDSKPTNPNSTSHKLLLGVVAGDMIGKPYERKKDSIHTTDFPLFEKRSKYTDDTILTIAVMDWLMSDESHSWDILEEKIVSYATTSKRFKGQSRCFSDVFTQWLKDKNRKQGRISDSNGAVMRVTPVGWFFDDIDTVEKVAKIQASLTHNHPDAICGAKAVAASILLARQGKTKNEIRDFISSRYNINLNYTLEEYRKVVEWSTNGKLTAQQALIAFLETDDFESAIRNAVALGTDSDTVGAITGGIAEAFYGDIPEHIKEGIHRRAFPDEYWDIIKKFGTIVGF